jgi:hypothetical protein
MFDTVRDQLQGELDEIAAAGLGKRERVIASAQGAHVTLADGRELLNLCANNYLGLASHPAVVAAARDALGTRGYGMASVRFICGTQDIHRELEERISAFLGTEDTILYGSCFDANAGLFETLLGEDDAIISDALNHASIIDGVRLCKARRLRYANADMDELEQRLSEAGGARRRLIATDGVFSMDGYVAPLPRICELAERYGAMVMVDDSPSASTSSRARSARPSAVPAAATRAAAARRSSCCASARARTSSPTASPRRSWLPAWPCSTCSRARARRCARGSSLTPSASAASSASSGSTSCPESTRSCP